MIYEGVAFVETEVKKMSKEVFIKRHIDAFWPKKDKETRKKMLADVYQRIVGKTKKK